MRNLLKNNYSGCQFWGFVDGIGWYVRHGDLARMVSDVWTDLHRIRHNRGHDNHPCQLPLLLLERLVLMTTDEGDLVLDPFLGTGTTAIAATKLGRRYVGFEMGEDFVSIAQRKLSDVLADSKIGNLWVSFHLGGIATLRNAD